MVNEIFQALVFLLPVSSIWRRGPKISLIMDVDKAQSYAAAADISTIASLELMQLDTMQNMQSEYGQYIQK